MEPIKDEESFACRPALYYCIGYDLDLLDEIKAICLSDHRFTDLGNDVREIDNGKNIFFRSTNSDKDGCATRGFIAVDELTIEGDDFDQPDGVFLQFEPAECLKKEKLHSSGINFITDLYDLIISIFKKKKLKFDDKIKLGWTFMSCVWEEGSGSEESDDEDIVNNNNNVDTQVKEVKATGGKAPKGKGSAPKTVPPKKSPAKKGTSAKKPKNK
ncbi:hypothetical protein EBR37_02710 [bacterium]|nr:hypothetical protein [bacterium]